MRDRDGIYGEIFKQRVKNLGIEEVVSAHSIAGAESVCRAADRLDSP